MKHIKPWIVAMLITATGIVCSNAADNKTVLPNFNKIGYTTKIIESFYLDSIDNGKMEEEAIIAMLKTLDPHSQYSNPEETKELVTPLEGNFSGIGIQFNMLNDTLIVIQTTSGGPSEKVGILPGDKILSADTTMISGIGRPRSEIMKALRGPKGTKVDIKVARRNEPEPLEFRITRDDIPVNSVDAYYMAAPEVGYLRLSRFSETSFEEVEQALKSLEKQGMKRLIFDLEDNGGGILGAAVEIAELFLNKGDLITYTESPKLGTSPYMARSKGRYADIPVIVMVNQYSASASEILSGALQDHDRGVVVGRRTFGKGLVQRPFPFPDGSMIRLTVARYHTPSGRVIQRPYEKGKRREYYLDHLRRYDDPVRDSLDAGAPEYRTLRTGRTVYGGGGIRPDVLVGADTAGFSAYYANLIRRGVVNEYVISYMDRERAALEKAYPTFEAFDKGFEAGDAMLEGLTGLGGQRGVEFDEQGFAASAPLMRIQLKALVAQRLFDTAAFYRVMNPAQNEAYRRAVEILADWEHKGESLLAPED